MDSPGAFKSTTAAANSVLLNLLTTRADKRDTIVFAHAAAETQSTLGESYQSQLLARTGGQQASPSQAAPGFLEVFPRVSSRPPRLLQDLEGLLTDRLRSNDRMTTTSSLLTKDRDPSMSQNLWLDAHRHVLTSFREGFGTYAPLLAKIQEEFESALDQGIRCTMENVEMRKMISDEEARRAKAQGQLRSKIMSGELEYRKDAFARLQELKSRMERAVKRASLAEKELSKTLSDEARLEALVSKLKQQQQSLLDLQKRELVWADLPQSSSISTIRVGGLSQEDERFLKTEYVATASKNILPEP